MKGKGHRIFNMERGGSIKVRRSMSFSTTKEKKPQSPPQTQKHTPKEN
jgi:hypothetical protein